MRSWKFWLGLAISALFVYWTAAGLDWPAFVAALRQAQYWWLAPAVAVYFAAVWARTWRWHYMLRHMSAIPLGRLFPVVVIGYMGNNIYPARAGEVIRSYILKRNEGVSISASLATVALERLFDGLVICAFVFATLPFVSLSPVYRVFVAGLSALFFVALLVFLGLAARPEQTDQLAARIIARLVPERLRPRVGDLATKFLRGLGSLRSPREVLLIFLTSIIIWTIETLTYWFVMQAFPFSVSFPALMLMTAVVNLFTMIPSAPGYVGTFDTAGVQVLKSFGILGTLATAYTVLLHFALWLPITLLGLFYMSRESLKWRDIDVAVGESQNGATVERQVPGPSSLGIVLALAGLATLSGYL